MKIKVPFSEGFTLLEVLIAVAILAGAVVTILFSLNYHLDLLQRQAFLTEATEFAKELFEEISEGAIPPDGEARYSNLHYRVLLQEGTLTGIYMVVLEVEKGSDTIIMKRLIGRKQAERLMKIKDTGPPQ